jgi:hypothetical protein
MVASLPKCYVFGASLVSNLSNHIIAAMSSIDFISKAYPMLTEWGLRDEDVLVHSLGCSAWNILGMELGFMALTECPSPTTHGADIRLDSTWFDRIQRKPAVLVEFERFDGTSKGQQKLDEKIRNLLEAAMRWDHFPSVLVLSAWSKGVVSAPDLEKLLARCRSGFKSSAGVQVLPMQSVTVLFSRFIFDVEKNGGLLLKQTRCTRLA